MIIAFTGLSVADDSGPVTVTYDFSPETYMVNANCPKFAVEISRSSDYDIDNINRDTVRLYIGPSQDDLQYLGTFSTTRSEINEADKLALMFERQDLSKCTVNNKPLNQYLIEDICDGNRFGTVYIKVEGAYSGNEAGYVGVDAVQVLQNRAIGGTGGPRK